MLHYWKKSQGTFVACWLLALALLASALWFPTGATAQPAPSEHMVKAIYLSKFRHYVTWPAGHDAGARTVIGVIGADDVAEQLLELPSLKNSVTVRRLRTGDSLEGVHIVFIGDNYFSRAAAVIEQAGARNVLVVTESDGALLGGSVLNFRLVDERLRFEVSMDSADKAGLKLSSQLLALAVSVIRKTK